MISEQSHSPNEMDTTTKRRKVQTEINHCLQIFGIRSALINKKAQEGQFEEVKEMLSSKLMDLISKKEELGLEAFLETFDPELEVTDMTTIHEAYQFLVNEYVENGGQSIASCFLTIEQIRANNKRRGSRASVNSSDSRRGSYADTLQDPNVKKKLANLHANACASNAGSNVTSVNNSRYVVHTTPIICLFWTQLIRIEPIGSILNQIIPF